METFVKYIDSVGNEGLPPLNKHHRTILEVYNKGYRVTDEGKLCGPKKVRELKLYGKQIYPSFTVTIDSKVCNLSVHKFAAYCFYGSKVFEPGIHVRHLNGDVLDISKQNIQLGTPSQNNLDKPVKVRIAAAKKARAAQPFTPLNAKLTEEQVQEIKKIYHTQKNKKFKNGVVEELKRKYGVSKTVIANIGNGTQYPNVFIDLSTIELVSVSGTDLTVANSARISFNKLKTEFDEKDAKLIRYLAEHEHTSPFRHAHATFSFTCPIFVARQLHKHQVGMSTNECSLRYISAESTAWRPDYFRDGDKNVKQGSKPEKSNNHKEALHLYNQSVKLAEKTYNRLIKLGICKEQARAVLPLGTYTSFWMTGSLQAWAHLYNLRSKTDAQEETRKLAVEIGKIMAQLFPHSWEALTK